VLTKNLFIIAVQTDETEGHDVVSSKLLNTLPIISKSSIVLTPVINELELDYSYNQLKDSILVSVIPGTDLITIKVTLDDADLAAAVANTITVKLIEELKTQAAEVNISVLNLAVASDDPIGSNTTLNVIIGFVLGGMLSVGFILLREFLDHTIKTEEDVEHYLDVPVIGVVPTL